jgi:hypothetical protein
MGFAQKLRNEVETVRRIEEFIKREEAKQFVKNTNAIHHMVERFKKDTLEMRALEDAIRQERVVLDKRETKWMD